MSAQIPVPPAGNPPAEASPKAKQTHVSVSKEAESEAQQANNDGNKIIGKYGVVNDANKNHIGFDGDKFSMSEDLGTTATLNKIYLNRFNYPGDKNVNMSLTKINKDQAEEYLFSIKLNDDSVIDESINNFLQSVGVNVKIYLFGITTGNKIDFTKLYEFKKGTILPDALSLKYILFIGNGKIYKINWKADADADTDADTDAPTDEEKTFTSFKYDKIILIHSSDTEFPTEGITKIDAKKDILSKEALFCIYSIDFITFTTDSGNKLRLYGFLISLEDLKYRLWREVISKP